MMFSSPHVGNVLTRKVSRTQFLGFWNFLSVFFWTIFAQNSDFKFAKGILTTIYKIHNQGAGIRPGQ